MMYWLQVGLKNRDGDYGGKTYTYKSEQFVAPGKLVLVPVREDRTIGRVTRCTNVFAPKPDINYKFIIGEVEEPV